MSNSFHRYYAALCVGIFFLLCAGIFIPGIEASTRKSMDGSRKPNRTECRRLYRHQLKLMQSGQNPIAPVLRLYERELRSENGKSVQRKVCRQMDRKYYACQMQARNPAHLFSCYQRHQRPGGRTTSKKNVKVAIASAAKFRRPSAGSCRKTYELMLGVYKKPAPDSSSTGHARLLRHWRSRTARASFQRRCVRAFRKGDVRCILAARDRLAIQACLFTIPR